MKSGAERILVAGCGAVGSVFACLLAEHGASVDVLGRGEHHQVLAPAGITLEGIWGPHHASPALVADTVEQLRDSYEAILIACKSFQTRGLVHDLSGRLASGGVAISLQNGLGNWEQLAEVFGNAHVLAGRVIFGAEIVAAGTVRVTVEAEPVLIGHPNGPSRAAEHWAEMFERAGIHACASDNILAALWGKVFYNAALNPMGALLGLRYGELAADPQRRRVMDRLIEEAFAVATAERVAMPWRDAREYTEHFYGRLVPATAGHRSSMLQALEKGRPTEIDAICGEVCRRGETAGVDTPSHRLLLTLLDGRGSKGHA